MVSPKLTQTSVKVHIRNRSHNLVEPEMTKLIQEWLNENQTLFLNKNVSKATFYEIKSQDGNKSVIIDIVSNDSTSDNQDKKYTVFQLSGGKPRKNTFESMTVADLKQRCVKRNIKGYSSMRKAELIAALRK